MLKRLYVHNFRCFENFDLALGQFSSVLLIGPSGAGKTTVGVVLEILQAIGRGTSRVSELVQAADFKHGGDDPPMRIEIDVELGGKVYAYLLAFEFPDGFKEPRVAAEQLSVDGELVFSRATAMLLLTRVGRAMEARLNIDWHLVALPVMLEGGAKHPVAIFKNFMASILILRPVPSMASGNSNSEAIVPKTSVANLGAWFAGVVAAEPSAYVPIHEYLLQIMPDFQSISNPFVAKEARSLAVKFAHGGKETTLPVEALSDGERCFLIFALAIAANKAGGPLLCYWDEPDNFLFPAEVGASILALRKAFLETGQLILVSHSPETIRHFADENTLYLSRESHLDPTRVHTVADLRSGRKFHGNFIEALLRGDVEP